LNKTLKIFNLIRHKGALAPFEISELLSIPKSTVSMGLKQLLTYGIIRKKKIVGSKRAKFKINEHAGYVAGIDLGQTHLYIGIFNLDGDLVDSIREKIILIDKEPYTIVNKIIENLKYLIDKNSIELESFLAVGLGVPAVVDYKHKVLISPPVMPKWDNYFFTDNISQIFSCPVYIDNDVNIMALGEKKKGIGVDIDNFLMIKVATGIGMGIIVSNKIYRGDVGSAGDIGHIGVDGNENKCWCGNIGCLEASASSRGLVKKAYDLLESNASDFLLNAQKRQGNIDIETIIKGSLEGNHECQNIIHDAARDIGEVLSKLVNAFNPKLIILDGELVMSGERFLAIIKESIYKRSTPLSTSKLEIKKSKLSGNNAIIGAAFLAINELFDNENIKDILKNSKIEGLL